jgi:hypothetical protein
MVKIGQLKKYVENLSASSVADVTISWERREQIDRSQRSRRVIHRGSITHLEVLAFLDGLLQEAEEDVRVERALVGLVEHYHRVGLCSVSSTRH